MTFRLMALVMTGAGCLLGLRFLFAGESVLREWGLAATAGSLIVSRRIGAIYLGLALLFFLGRAAAPSELRSATCLVAGGTIALLAALGLLDFAAARVTAGMTTGRASGRSSARTSNPSPGQIQSLAHRLHQASARSSQKRCSRQASPGCGGAGAERTEDQAVVRAQTGPGCGTSRRQNDH